MIPSQMANVFYPSHGWLLGWFTALSLHINPHFSWFYDVLVVG